MATLSSPDQWTPNDIVPPENRERWMLDRDIADVNTFWSKIFGFGRSPVGWAVRMLHQTGELAIADFGCGTANTLVTWRNEVLRRAKVPLAAGSISCTGISLYDYRTQSLNPVTRTEIAGDKINYVVGNATTPLLPPNSQDIVLANSAIGPRKAVTPWLEHMLAATKPEGMMFFEVTRQYLPEVEALRAQWARAGHDSTGQVVRAADVQDQYDHAFFIVRKAEAPSVFVSA